MVPLWLIWSGLGGLYLYLLISNIPECPWSVNPGRPLPSPTDASDIIVKVFVTHKTRTKKPKARLFLDLLPTHFIPQNSWFEAFRGISLSGRPLFPHLGYGAVFLVWSARLAVHLEYWVTSPPCIMASIWMFWRKRFFEIQNCVELDPIMFDFEAGSGQKPCQSSRSQKARARQGNKGTSAFVLAWVWRISSQSILVDKYLSADFPTLG